MKVISPFCISLMAGAVVSSEGSMEARSASKPAHMVVSRPQFLTGRRTEGLSSLLSVSWGPLLVPHHRASHNRAGRFPQSKRSEEASAWGKGGPETGTGCEIPPFLLHSVR